MPDNSRQRQIGAILSYSHSIISAVIGLLYVPILLSTMGSSEYGLYQLIGSIMSYMSLMNSIFSGGITRYYCKYLSTGDTEKMQGVLAAGRQIYAVMSFVAVAVGFVAIIVFWIAYQSVLSEFQLVESGIMLAAISINLIVSMQNSLSLAVVIANERFIFQRGIQLVLLIAQPFIVVSLVWIFPYAVLIPLIQLVLNCIAAFIQWLFAHRRLEMTIKKYEDSKSLIRNLLVFSSGLLLVLIADQIFWRTNQLILGFFYGMTTVAIYAVASQIVTSYMALGTAIPQVFLPRVIALMSSNSGINAVSELFIKVGRLTLYPLLLVMTGFLVFGIPFIDLWAGSDFEEAYYIALILMIAATIDLSQNLGLTILQAINKYHIRGIIYICLAIGNCATVLFFAPIIGIVGVAVCSAVAMFVGNGIVMNYYYSKSVGLNIKDFWIQVLRLAVPLILLGIVAYFIVNAVSIEWNWQLLIVALLVYCILFFVVAFGFSMNSYERGIVKRLILRSSARK